MYLRFRQEQVTNTEQNHAFKQTVKILQQFVFKDPKQKVTVEEELLLWSGADVPDAGHWLDIPIQPLQEASVANLSSPAVEHQSQR